MSVLSFARPIGHNTTLSGVVGAIRKCIVLMGLLGAVGACGQIGPLYLPDATPEEATAEAPESTEEATEAENE